MSFFSLLQSSPAVLVTTAVLAGLLVGSFLNVVIHRLPKMMERQWRAECAELTGTAAPARRALQSGGAALGMPEVRARDHRAREHPDRKLYRPRRKVLGMQGTDLPALSGRRGAFRRALRLHCLALWLHSAAMLGALIFAWAMIALAFIDLDTFYLPDNITLPLLWAGPAAQHRRCFHRPSLGCDRRSGRLSRVVDRVSGPTSSPPARKAWATATSSCSPRSAPGSAGRCCRSRSCSPPSSAPPSASA